MQHPHKITLASGIVTYVQCYGSHDKYVKKVDWKGYLVSFLAGVSVIAIFTILADAALKANGL